MFLSIDSIEKFDEKFVIEFMGTQVHVLIASLKH
jgi:hypothetical protein